MAVRVAVKFGPWGAADGTPCDINNSSYPQRLVIIRIWSNESPGGCIEGLSFTYVDQIDVPINVGIGGFKGPYSLAEALYPNKKLITIGTWTIQYNGGFKKIKLHDDEYIRYVSGTANETGVTSLMLRTNKKTIGPYGWPEGPEFSLPLEHGQPNGGGVVAFFGNISSNLKALGVYVLQDQLRDRVNYVKKPIRVGPWGPWFSPYFPWGPPAFSTPEQLQSITIRSSERSGGRIYGFACICLDQGGDSISVESCESSTKGEKHVFAMNKDNYITYIGGTYDRYGITSLKFISTQDVYGPFGCPTGTAFSVLLQENAGVVSFFGYHNVYGLIGYGASIMPQETRPLASW